MRYHRLSDKEILNGFRKGNADIIRDYFYGYCEVGYNIFDQRYQLRGKQNLDFMSLAHQYAIFLMEHDWKPLEDHSPNISLKTWLINGFRYVVLDALKWYKKEYGSITFEDYLRSFDVISDLRLQFNHMVEDVCDHVPMGREERVIIQMMLLQGFKGKEVAAEMGVTPAAISHKYKKLKDNIIVPYFRENFDMDLNMPEVFDVYGEPMAEEAAMPPMGMERIKLSYRKFGAIMGQGVGLQGQSYGIPTMQGGVETIRPYVDEFIEFAKEHPTLTFLVTRIGCGIAGFTDEDISPLSEKAHDVENIVLPPGW